MKVKGSDSGTIPRWQQNNIVGKAGTAKAKFSDVANQVHTNQWKHKLDQLLLKVSRQGEILVKNRTLPELFKYKKLVQSFLKEAVEGMYQLEEHTGWTRRGTHQSLITVKQVDEELAKLTGLLKEEEKDPLLILEQVDHIRGLLMDIYL